MSYLSPNKIAEVTHAVRIVFDSYSLGSINTSLGSIVWKNLQPKGAKKWVQKSTGTGLDLIFIAPWAHSNTLQRFKPTVNVDGLTENLDFFRTEDAMHYYLYVHGARRAHAPVDLKLMGSKSFKEFLRQPRQVSAANHPMCDRGIMDL